MIIHQVKMFFGSDYLPFLIPNSNSTISGEAQLEKLEAWEEQQKPLAELLADSERRLKISQL